METKVSEYKGHKILGLFQEGKDKPTVSFGVKKAQAILENIKDIKDFVKANKVATPKVAF